MPDHLQIQGNDNINYNNKNEVLVHIDKLFVLLKTYKKMLLITMKPYSHENHYAKSMWLYRLPSAIVKSRKSAVSCETRNNDTGTSLLAYC